MGAGETGTPTKAAKVATPQEQPPAHSYPEWAAAFQAYYNSGGQPPAGFFPPSVASSPHPYMWGGQPMMPPYGGPPHPSYGAMYPHGGMYGHPPMQPGSHLYGQYGMPSPGGATEAMIGAGAGMETDTKPLEGGKNPSPLKRMKGSKGGLAMVTGKGREGGKGNTGSANGVFSHSSNESGSEGSSEGSEEDNSQNILRKRSFEQVTLDAVGVGGTSIPPYDLQAGGAAVPAGGAPSTGQAVAGAGPPPVGAPAPSLDIGLDYWSGSAPATLGVKAGKQSSASTSTGMLAATSSAPTGSRDNVPPELWLQDEREVKRQRRKQSNRESARRSRLRKQAECEELGTRVDTLSVENMALRTELSRVSEECKRLQEENATLLKQLRQTGVDDGEEAQEQQEAAVVKEEDSRRVQPEGNGKVQERASKGTSPKGKDNQKDDKVTEESAVSKVMPSPPLDATGSNQEAVAAG